MKNFYDGPVVPIPPSYTSEGKLDLDETCRYVRFLYKNGIKVIMTTVGTSQFNLLTRKEIRELKAKGNIDAS